MPSIFLRDKYTNDVSIENADNEQNDHFKMFGNLNKAENYQKKFSFKKMWEIC